MPRLPATPRFLCVFLRGGYDCANFLVPYSSSFYYEKPTAGSPSPEPDPAINDGALALDSDWALAPAVRDSLGPLYQQRQALFIPFAGTEDLTRSHFETQDSIELGAAAANDARFPLRVSGAACDARSTVQRPIAFTDSLAAGIQGRCRHREHFPAAGRQVAL